MSDNSLKRQLRFLTVPVFIEIALVMLLGAVDTCLSPCDEEVVEEEYMLVNAKLKSFSKPKLSGNRPIRTSSSHRHSTRSMRQNTSG